MADGLLDAAAADGADSVLLGGEADRRLAGRLIHEAACSVWWVPDRPPTGIRRILVPVDYSTRAADSLRVATALARLSGAAECLALHVYFNDSPLADRRQDRVLRGQLAHSHARFLAGIDCLGVQVAARFQEAPDVARAIARTAEEEQADLIVMASRGRTRAGALLRESKAGRALDETRVPLLVVKHFGAQLGLFRVVREQVLGRANELRFN
jgi:nucleotide-binding universal stress UspA family protein